MARIRTIKPEFYLHYGLYQLEKESGLPIRISFAGLWNQCDRQGRFKWIPPELKIGIIPYDEVDFSRVLDALMTREFIMKYRVENRDYGFIPTWHQHQVINNRERESIIPEPNENNILTRESRVDDAKATRDPRPLSGREGKGREPILQEKKEVIALSRGDSTVDDSEIESLIGGKHEA